MSFWIETIQIDDKDTKIEMHQEMYKFKVWHIITFCMWHKRENESVNKVNYGGQKVILANGDIKTSSVWYFY